MQQHFVRLRSAQHELVIDVRSGQPAIGYWGSPLDASDDALAELLARPVPPASTEAEAPIGLVPQLGVGFPGVAALRCHRDGQAVASAAALTHIDEGDGSAAEFIASCSAGHIELRQRLSIDSATGVLSSQSSLRNTGDDALTVDELPAVAIPVASQWAVTGYEGRWALEFQPHTIAPFVGAYVRENRAGRTSHHTPPVLFLHEPSADETHGHVIVMHLAWSGNHRAVAETLPDGRRYACLEAQYFPGEMRLAPGEALTTPVVNAVLGQSGFQSTTDALHGYCRGSVLRPAMRAKPRPVHFNTWEALYFDVSEASLAPLIDQAADLGIERFVLDDGWFIGRNDDTAALGDWRVDSKKFPDGLSPVAARVVERGMEFGLWIEPEMVNPDSELYRAHPDWVQSFAGIPTVLARHQLVLDLSRRDVQAYLLAAISELLETLPIRYLKWDMNRDLTQPGGADGAVIATAHTEALYAMLATLRERFPAVEIESCASGGGRADYGVLAVTDRIWTSDSNDALDRLAIQRGFSRLFPPEVMGAHVGPFECHITGRRLSMAFRAGVALFGHMGVEADIRALDDAERVELARAIEYYKQHRSWMHDGRSVQLETAPPVHAHGVVARDGHCGLFLCAMVATPAAPVPAPLRLSGLDDNASYTVEEIWPVGSAPSGRSADTEYSGRALQQLGLPLPVMRPESLKIFLVKRTSD